MTGKIQTFRRRVLVGTGALAIAVSGAVIGTVGGAGAQNAAPAAVKNGTAATLDHFTCYLASAAKSSTGATSFTPPGAVELFNQFAPKGLYAAIGNIAFHCNPVQKTVLNTKPPTVTLITNPNGHLLCWTTPQVATTAATTQPSYRVLINNQFGTELFDTLQPVLLCLPTWKSLTGPPNQTQVQPPGLDHFLCYTVKEDPNSPSRFTPPPLELQDQFMAPKEVKATAVVPNLLCLPTAKNLSPLTGAVPTNFNDPHLMCFSLKVGAVRAPTVFDQNQFGTGAVTIKKLEELCVPSTKEVTSGGGQIVVTKTDPAGIPLIGATFTAYASTDTSKTTPLGTCTTGAAGVCTISGLAAPAGYIVSETTPPTGYSAGPDQDVSITTSPGAVGVTFIDCQPAVGCGTGTT
jgi:hypothetical protein